MKNIIGLFFFVSFLVSCSSNNRIQSSSYAKEKIKGDTRALEKETAITPRPPFNHTDATEVSMEGEGITLHELLPYDAKENYTVEIFEIVKNLEKHYHKIPTQLMLVLDGPVEIILGSKSFDLENGDFIVIPPNIMHEIKPKGKKSRFLTVDFPGFNYPDSGYKESPINNITTHPYIFRQHMSERKNYVDTQTTLPSEIAPMMQILTDIIPKYYLQKKECKEYISYDIASDYNNKWTITLLDILENTSKTFHKNTHAHFILLTGELEILIEKERYSLLPGQSMHMRPNTIYSLKSAKKGPARVLYIERQDS